MNQESTILLIGLHADSVDYQKWPDLSPEKLEAAFEAIRNELIEAGFNATWCLTDTGDNAEQMVSDHIENMNPDVVLIGAGIRSDPDHFLLFEKVINIVHQQAPNAKIAFNTNPFDTTDAVKRWL